MAERGSVSTQLYAASKIGNRSVALKNWKEYF